MTDKPTVKQLLQQATTDLSAREEIDAWFEARLLLAFCLEKNQSWLMAWPEAELPIEDSNRFKHLIQNRLEGKPVAYITGKREFWGLELSVTPDTLIPRPETELLVEIILEQKALPDKTKVLDLGTGSGAIAAAIKKEKPDWPVTATDTNEKTLKVAQKNFQSLGLQINTLLSDWFENIPPQQFDIIVSNPPYIEKDDIHLQQGDVRFEPKNALVSGPDGLDDIRQIIKKAADFLENDGLLVFEHGYNQGQKIQQILEKQGFKNIQTQKDLNQQPRATFAYK